MENKDSVKLIHVETPAYTHIVPFLKKHLPQKPLEQIIAIYAGAGGYSVVSADPAVYLLLMTDSGQELFPDSLLYYALSREPEALVFYYGNKDLIKQLPLE